MPNPLPPLGNLVRIVPLEWTALPAHPSFPDHKPQEGVESHKPENSESSSSTVTPNTLIRQNRPQLIPFIKDVLDQGVSFVDEIVPRIFKPGKSKKSSPAKADVQLLKRDISGSELRQVQWSESLVSRTAPSNTSEAWLARKSQHSNQKGDGTANFAEFAIGLRDDHSEHEREYTPDVYDSYKVLDWDDETAKDDLKIDGYSRIRMSSRYPGMVSWFVLTG